MGIDVVTYAGQISVTGYELLCQKLEDRKSDKVVLVLATPGGDPHAGFRIARALQHTYGGFEALVPRYCKSAGTLILIGATKLYLDDRSELGPLDVQVKKGDELVGRNSGLDIFQAVNFLQNQAIATFRNLLHELARDGLSTRVGADIAVNLTGGLLEPIAAQIDPIKLAEMQRATEIAFEYGNRLNASSGMMRRKGIEKLVTGYPSHGFVIDRKEARTVFAKVQKPEGFLLHLSRGLGAEMEGTIGAATPTVNLHYFEDAEVLSEDTSIAQGGPAGAPERQSEIAGDRPEARPAEAAADAAEPAAASAGAAPVRRKRVPVEGRVGGPNPR